MVPIFELAVDCTDLNCIRNTTFTSVYYSRNCGSHSAILMRGRMVHRLGPAFPSGGALWRKKLIAGSQLRAYDLDLNANRAESTNHWCGNI